MCRCLGFSLLLGAFMVSAAQEGFEIGEAACDEAFWKSDAVLFVQKHREQGFKFTAEDRQNADSRREGGVTCFGLPVYETRVTFAGNEGIARLELMLFNRGGTERIEEIQTADGKTLRRIAHNEKPMTREEFFETLEKVRARLTVKGAKVPAVQNQRTKNASIRQRVQTWPKTEIPTIATLMWNYTQVGQKTFTFKPGFIRLAIDGPQNATAQKARATAGAPTARGASKITENIVRESRGDVFVDNVPMVDQGAKGYCAVSAAERVMRYYGLDVDEHEIAEAAGTQVEGGTNNREMKQAVEAIGKRYRLATLLLYGDFEAANDVRIANLGQEVANYNKAAKKLRKKEITEAVYVTHKGNVTYYDPGAVDNAMDPEVRKEMKTNGAQKAKFAKFKKNIHQYVDMGMPLFWGVVLGIYPEEDLPQAKGGHMRLIIGYNDKKDEILYTDTWGKGHELKRMSASWAWTISRSLMVMKPLK